MALRVGTVAYTLPLRTLRTGRGTMLDALLAGGYDPAADGVLSIPRDGALFASVVAFLQKGAAALATIDDPARLARLEAECHYFCIPVTEPREVAFVLQGGPSSMKVFQTYDVLDDAWHAVPVRSLRDGARHQTAVCALGQHIYCIGGVGSCSVRTYALATGAWRARAPLAHDPIFHGVVAWAGKIYVVGGYSPRLQRKLTGLAVYAPGDDAWTTLPPLPEARTKCAVCALHGVLYVMGGFGPFQYTETDVGQLCESATVRTVFGYTVATRAWHTGVALPVALASIRGCVAGGAVYVAGVCAEAPARARLYRFTPGATEWVWVSSLPESRREFGMFAAQGGLHIVGGYYANGQRSKRVDVYDPLQRVWETRRNIGSSLANFGCGVCSVETNVFTRRLQSLGANQIARRDGPRR